MILCVECGNTAIKFGFFDENELKYRYLLKSQDNLSSDDYAIKIKILLENKILKIEGAIISSVVPSLTNILKNAVSKIFDCDVTILNRQLKTKIPLKIDNPRELGTDFLCTAVGAMRKYDYPFVIADLGTATKLSVVDKNGNFIGCIITAGMKVSLKSLVANTAQLYDVEVAAPKKIIGKNSIDSIQSGIVYGQAYMVSEFARRIENELGYPINRVLTGGYSSIIKNEIVCFNYYENLSLEGLYNIYLMNREEK